MTQTKENSERKDEKSRVLPKTQPMTSNDLESTKLLSTNNNPKNFRTNYLGSYQNVITILPDTIYLLFCLKYLKRT